MRVFCCPDFCRTVVASVVPLVLLLRSLLAMQQFICETNLNSFLDLSPLSYNEGLYKKKKLYFSMDPDVLSTEVWESAPRILFHLSSQLLDNMAFVQKRTEGL